jgi:predicted transcriptional regulator
MAKRRAENREGMIITTIALSPELHRRLAMAALENNSTAAQLMRDAIEQFLHRYDQPSPRMKSR